MKEEIKNDLRVMAIDRKTNPNILGNRFNQFS